MPDGESESMDESHTEILGLFFKNLIFTLIICQYTTQAANSILESTH